jgi:hypothetical protein
MAAPNPFTDAKSFYRKGLFLGISNFNELPAGLRLATIFVCGFFAAVRSARNAA